MRPPTAAAARATTRSSRTRRRRRRRAGGGSDENSLRGCRSSRSRRSARRARSCTASPLSRPPAAQRRNSGGGVAQHSRRRGSRAACRCGQRSSARRWRRRARTSRWAPTPPSTSGASSARASSCRPTPAAAPRARAALHVRRLRGGARRRVLRHLRDVHLVLPRRRGARDLVGGRRARRVRGRLPHLEQVAQRVGVEPVPLRGQVLQSQRREARRRAAGGGRRRRRRRRGGGVGRTLHRRPLGVPPPVVARERVIVRDGSSQDS